MNYGEEVEIVSGFWKGHTGRVYCRLFWIHYGINLGFLEPIAWVMRWQIKRIPQHLPSCKLGECDPECDRRRQKERELDELARAHP